MNARSMYMTLLVSAGLGLSPAFADHAAANDGMQSAQDRIRQEQIADFHRRSLDDFPQANINVASAGFLDTGLADAAVELTNDHIRIQGRLAQWQIHEEQLVGFRTGMRARSLARQEVGVAAAMASTEDRPRLGQASGLLKSARFEWPEFMPPALLR